MIITIVRKPLVKNVCENITLHNTGGINIDQTRVGTEGGRTNKGGYQNSFVGGKVEYDKGKGVESDHTPKGRWPANVLLSDNSADLFPVVNKQAICKTDNKSGWQSQYVGGVCKLPVERKLHLEENNNASKFFKVVKENDN